MTGPTDNNAPATAPTAPAHGTREEARMQDQRTVTNLAAGATARQSYKRAAEVTA